MRLYLRERLFELRQQRIALIKAIGGNRDSQALKAQLRATLDQIDKIQGKP